MEKQDKQYLNAAGKFTARVKAPGNGWMDRTDSGSEFVRIPVLVEEGEQAGREAVWRGYLTEKAKLRTLQTLDDIFGKEWNFEMLAAGKVPWAGTLVRITVEEEDYNGEPRYKIKWLNPAAKAAKVEQTAVGKLDAELRALRGGAPAAPAVKTHDAEGDEIPF